MPINLSLGNQVPLLDPRILLVWQGFEPGENRWVAWRDGSGVRHSWSGSGTDGSVGPGGSYSEGSKDERWYLPLDLIPQDVVALEFGAVTNLRHPVGLSVQAIQGDAQNQMLHPGMDADAGVQITLLQINRGASHWSLVALNTATAPARENDGGSSGAEQGHSAAPIPIPVELEQAVARVRSGNGQTAQADVTVVLDLSASMRPWLVSGLLADTLVAFQALAGANNRPMVNLRVEPVHFEQDIRLESKVAEVLTEVVRTAGLQTGSPAQLAAAVTSAVERGGQVFVVTDDPEVTLPNATAGKVVTVAVGPAGGGSDVFRIEGNGPIRIGDLAKRLGLAQRELRNRQGVPR